MRSCCGLGVWLCRVLLSRASCPTAFYKNSIAHQLGAESATSQFTMAIDGPCDILSQLSNIMLDGARVIVEASIGAEIPKARMMLRRSYSDHVYLRIQDLSLLNSVHAGISSAAVDKERLLAPSYPSICGLLRRMIGLKQSLPQRIRRTHPSHPQRTCLFKPNGLWYFETHGRICVKILCESTGVAVLAAIDDTGNAVALPKLRFIGSLDDARKVAAYDLRRWEGH